MMFLAAAASGILSAFALPFSYESFRVLNCGALAWFALVPLLLAVKKSHSVKRAMGLGFAYGITHFFISLYWMVIALYRYGEVPLWASLLGLGLAVVLMSVFPMGACGVAFALTRRLSWNRTVWILPAVWTAFEWLRNFLPAGGFPWASLGYSQHGFLTLLQILDVTGVYGVIFLVVMGNAVVAMWIGTLGLGVAREAAKTRFAPTGWLIGLLAVALVYGHFRLVQIGARVAVSPLLKVALIQGNIPQEEKWQEEKVEEIINRHVEWTSKASSSSPDLVIWPEAAFPAVLPPELKSIGDLEDVKTDLLMGVVRYDGTMPETWPADDSSTFRLFNSAVLLKPMGEIEDRYDKVHLVPVGEYVPFAGWLPFLREIVESMGTFTEGKGHHLLNLKGKKFGTTICYEDLFPEISRTFVRGGADFLVNLTNDGWYDRSSAIFQHFDFSRYRAIESRLTMVRSTNTGVTGIFAPTGEVLASLPPFEEGILPAQVPLKPAGWGMSFYSRFGDVFAWGCVVFLVAVTLKAFRGRRKVNS